MGRAKKKSLGLKVLVGTRLIVSSCNHMGWTGDKSPVFYWRIVAQAQGPKSSGALHKDATVIWAYIWFVHLMSEWCQIISTKFTRIYNLRD